MAFDKNWRKHFFNQETGNETVLIFDQNRSATMFSIKSTQSVLVCLLSTAIPLFALAQNAAPPQRLSEVVVSESSGSQAEPLQEEQPVDENQQPEWTTRRRFSTTRVY